MRLKSSARSASSKVSPSVSTRPPKLPVGDLVGGLGQALDRLADPAAPRSRRRRAPGRPGGAARGRRWRSSGRRLEGRRERLLHDQAPAARRRRRSPGPASRPARRGISTTYSWVMLTGRSTKSRTTSEPRSACSASGLRPSDQRSSPRAVDQEDADALARLGPRRPRSRGRKREQRLDDQARRPSGRRDAGTASTAGGSRRSPAPRSGRRARRPSRASLERVVHGATLRGLAEVAARASGRCRWQVEHPHGVRVGGWRAGTRWSCSVTQGSRSRAVGSRRARGDEEAGAELRELALRTPPGRASTSLGQRLRPRGSGCRARRRAGPAVLVDQQDAADRQRNDARQQQRREEDVPQLQAAAGSVCEFA